jgi:asparagine synthetase B (glutamine-hydrolysing)
MCGLFGVASDNVKGFHLQQATDTLIHQGPDEGGTSINDKM